jgi:hypothetical protein
MNTYTQEMEENKELPTAGMTCMILNEGAFNTSYEECVINFIGNHIVVYSSGSCDERSCYLNLAKFRALTPPIELIDGERYEFELGFGDYRVGYYKKNLDSFFDGMLSVNRICVKSEASDIKLLEVKSNE